MARWRTLKRHMTGEKLPLQEEAPLSLTTRFKGLMVDLFMITMPICYGVIYGIMGNGATFAMHRAWGWTLLILFHALIIIPFWYIKGQTPGMKAYEMTLETTPKEKITLTKLFIRFVTMIIALPLILPLLLPFLRKDHRALHDILSGTHLRLSKTATL